MTNDSLAKLGDITKPATVLIEKISDAVGGIFRPHQIVRVAKEEAEAAFIEAESQIRITGLQRRAMSRFLEEEAKRQSNMEAVTLKVLPLLEEDSKPQNVADDWITNFFEKSRIVSDGQMQQIWARILAGEANATDTFAKQTVNLLADLDKGDAEQFARLCGFCWKIEALFLLVFDINGEIYNRAGVNFPLFSNLESLGLIRIEPIIGFVQQKLPQIVSASYFNRTTQLTFPAEKDNTLKLGSVLLTRAGRQLAPICGSTPVDGFFEYVYDSWAGQSLVPMRQTERVAPTEMP